MREHPQIIATGRMMKRKNRRRSRRNYLQLIFARNSPIMPFPQKPLTRDQFVLLILVQVSRLLVDTATNHGIIFCSPLRRWFLLFRDEKLNVVAHFPENDPRGLRGSSNNLRRLIIYICGRGGRGTRHQFRLCMRTTCSCGCYYAHNNVSICSSPVLLRRRNSDCGRCRVIVNRSICNIISGCPFAGGGGIELDRTMPIIIVTVCHIAWITVEVFLEAAFGDIWVATATTARVAAVVRWDGRCGRRRRKGHCMSCWFVVSRWCSICCCWCGQWRSWKFISRD